MSNPIESPKSSSSFLVAVLVSLGVILTGGIICGAMIDGFGVLGSISLWALGAAAAWIQSRFARVDKSNVILLIASMLIAFCVAEIFWINRNIVGAESIVAAIKKFPQFLIEFKIDAFFAAIMTAFGIGNILSQKVE